MALIECKVYSEALGMFTQFSVLMPPATDPDIENAARPGPHGLPTLYLLHGYRGDHTVWLRNTTIELQAAKRGLAVVMPACYRSFYADMAHGYRYWTFLSEELPELARTLFPLSARREDNYVAGGSMGGYGAVKWALNAPERFAKAASIHGAFDLEKMRRRPGKELDFRLVFGSADADVGDTNDVYRLARKAAASGTAVPDLFMCCGTEDEYYPESVHFRDYCRSLGLSVDYTEGPGEHEWWYVESMLGTVLDWLTAGRSPSA